MTWSIIHREREKHSPGDLERAGGLARQLIERGARPELSPHLWLTIAESALERKIGARGLRMIIEELMLDLMYQVPNQKKIREVTITREVVMARDKPITLIEKAG